MPNQTRRQFNAYQVSDAAEQRLLQAGLLYDGARISPNFFNTLRKVFRLIYTKNELIELMTATKAGNTNKVINLIRTKIADVNIKGEDGRTALSLAAERGHMAIVQFLLLKGANKSVEDAYGHNARWWAEFNCQTAIARLL